MMSEKMPSQGCPECGEYERVTPHPLERNGGYHFFNYWHNDGSFRYELECRSCGWTRKEMIKAVVIEE